MPASSPSVLREGVVKYPIRADSFLTVPAVRAANKQAKDRNAEFFFGPEVLRSRMIDFDLQ
jgi:hypothetical protein